MASAAIPVLFPAEGIGGQYFGDGALRDKSQSQLLREPEFKAAA